MAPRQENLSTIGKELTSTPEAPRLALDDDVSTTNGAIVVSHRLSLSPFPSSYFKQTEAQPLVRPASFFIKPASLIDLPNEKQHASVDAITLQNYDQESGVDPTPPNIDNSTHSFD